jgi:light-regulated signal transduction histidine kinase (bacteriophytochrome)
VRFEVAVDITELKKAQIEVRQLNEHLEEKVEERTAELEEAIRELEGFSYTVSHDLKAPLRSIIGYSNILLEDHREALDEDAQDVLDVIIRNTEKMRQLIDDILQMNRLGRKALTIEEVSLSTTANRVYRKLKGMTTGRKVDFEISGSLPKIQADPTMMEQLFSNLISNAIKFTANREIAQISVNYEQMNGQHIVSVKDNGAGYDQRYADKLFQIFQRLHSGNEFPGSGVGLAICKRIMDKHNGKIWSESVLDEGATFYISFPLKQNLKNQNHVKST